MSLTNIISPITALVTKICVSENDVVRKGQELIILEAMKMETAVVSEQNGKVVSIKFEEGSTVEKDSLLLQMEAITDGNTLQSTEEIKKQKSSISLLDELEKRKSYLLDEHRPKAVEKRNAKAQNTARKNIELLADPGSFKEYGGLTYAAQTSRRTVQDLIENTPADGLITGTATINRNLFKELKETHCLIMAYDFTVLAGTQGTMNHLKMDRVLAMALDRNLPVILFGEGGGGRPGDVDVQTIAGLHIHTFVQYARVKAPKIAIVSGYCFAGNAALVGSSDVVIATKNVSMGMGGPAMIEGGGLGKFHPKEVGPANIHLENGVIDVLADHETEAIQIAKTYLSYFQGDIASYEVEDQTTLRTMIPENRKRSYDIRAIIIQLADKDTFLELRKEYGKGMITGFIRMEGKRLGLIANNSSFEAGAITSENAIKAGEFLNLCNRFDIPILSLVDTPGIMVGPEAEKSGTVKHASRLFNQSAQLTAPFFTVVLRRAYGLGAMAMMKGSTHASDFTIAWPTGEFGAMGLEGAVKLGYRKELEAITDESERVQLYDRMVEEAYERGKALSMASMLEIDDVIDPADTREWIVSGLRVV